MGARRARPGLVGSFLNVVIYRLPVIIERAVVGRCRGASIIDARVFPLWSRLRPPSRQASSRRSGGLDGDRRAQARCRLARPRSRCGVVRPQDPLVREHPHAELARAARPLRGLQDADLGLRYPLIELATGVLFAARAWRFGAQPATLAVVRRRRRAARAVADRLGHHRTCPTRSRCRCCGAGSSPSPLGWLPDAPAAVRAVWGAVAGYLALWLVCWCFKLATGKEGMGYRRLQAAGRVRRVARLARAAADRADGLDRRRRHRPAADARPRRLAREAASCPFGPFLAGGGLVVMLRRRRARCCNGSAGTEGHRATRG